jgi:hypothetical protein
MPDLKQTLLQELRDSAESDFSSGRRSNLWHTTLSIGVILSSLIATAAAATEWYRSILAFLAALPAAFATAEKTFQPRKLSQWYFQRSTLTDTLATELAYDAHPDLSSYATRFAQIQRDMESLWKQIGEDAVPTTAAEQKKIRQKADAKKQKRTFSSQQQDDDHG